MLSVIRPRIPADERVIWRRDPLETNPPYESFLGLDQRVWATVTLVLFFVIASLSRGAFDGLRLANLLITAFVLALVWRALNRGGIFAHTVTERRIILSPWRSIPLVDLVSVKTVGEYIKLEAATRFFHLGPTPDATEVTDLIRKARANA